MTRPLPRGDTLLLASIAGSAIANNYAIQPELTSVAADLGVPLGVIGLVPTAALAGSMTVFGLLARSAIASVILVFLLGLSGFAGVPGMITRVTDFAHGAALAASANVSASNVGNALGAWLGGLAITAGFGCTAPLYVGAGITLTSVLVMAVAARRAGRTAS
ncbi:hypothetical protein GQF42_41015 [Streptomyces broussonetiae]|uniref:MFS transporter n=1 Tax=Streptomyces broussonetiae TaxID=2686304 RepID=A0A6I6NBE5_9ACTN|nr:hypothetical protein GQF42_41015 [Streptomyces broussonetiae]